MQTFEEQLNRCSTVIKTIADMINKQGMHSEQISSTELYNTLYVLVPLIPLQFKIYRDRIRDIILPNIKIKDGIGFDRFGRQITIPNNGINSYLFGQAMVAISLLTDVIKKNEENTLWGNIHPSIVAVSQTRFENGSYADSVEAAFKEINVRVKDIVKKKNGNELDGTSLMQKAFSANNPILILADIFTITGRDVQQGYMEMFTGSIRAIRNSKAHNNQVISKKDAIRELYFASLLMSKIDNATFDTRIME